MADVLTSPVRFNNQFAAPAIAKNQVTDPSAIPFDNRLHLTAPKQMGGGGDTVNPTHGYATSG